jgi:hypothetical protein
VIVVKYRVEASWSFIQAATAGRGLSFIISATTLVSRMVMIGYEP